MKQLTAAITLAALIANTADAHCYSIWRYNFPQRCNSRVAQAPVPVPSVPLDIDGQPIGPPPRPLDMPLPSLEGMEFPPDCLADWCQRLKGVGMLRDKFGTN